MFNAEVLLVVLVCHSCPIQSGPQKQSPFMYLVMHQLPVTAVPQEILRAKNVALFPCWSRFLMSKRFVN